MEELEQNQDFLDAGVDSTALADIQPRAQTAVLERLGPAHFRSKGFSFMGFLQTVYDQAAQSAGATAPPDALPEQPPTPTPAPTDVPPPENVERRANALF